MKTYKETSRQKITKWLDKNIRAYTTLYNNRELKCSDVEGGVLNCLVANEPCQIQMYGAKQVCEVAECLNLEILTEPLSVPDPRYNILVYFTYRDFKFFAVGSKEELE